MSTISTAVTVKIEDPASRDRQLELAVSAIRDRAIDCGIVITRVDFTTFTIALSRDVTFGLTREIDLL